MSLLDEVLNFIQKNSLDQRLDQNFLISKKAIDDLVNVSQIKKTDIVLEIGLGLGFLTEALALKAKKVIAVEIDERFKPFLKKLPKNVQVIYGDIYRLLCNKDFILKIGKIDKIVSNPPYSKIENIFHPLQKRSWYQGDLFFIAPLSLVNKINKNPIFSAYFQAILIKKLSKKFFYPPPKTSSGIIHFKRLPPPEKTGRIDIYLRRFLYERESWKLKNALREGIVCAFKIFQNQFVSKNQAREIIKQMAIEQEELEKQVYHIKKESYYLISEKGNDLLTSLG